MNDLGYQIFVNAVAGILVAIMLAGIHAVWKWFKKQRWHFEFRFDANGKDE